MTVPGALEGHVRSVCTRAAAIADSLTRMDAEVRRSVAESGDEQLFDDILRRLESLRDAAHKVRELAREMTDAPAAVDPAKLDDLLRFSQTMPAAIDDMFAALRAVRARLGLPPV